MFSHIIIFGSSLPELLGGHSLCTIICGRVLSIRPFTVTISPDAVPPTADLAYPSAGASVRVDTLNGLGYLDVTFAAAGGSGLDASTIDGNELTLSGSGVGTAVLDGAATLVSGSTYRYSFTGDFAPGTVDVNFGSTTWQDIAGNDSVAETETFTVLPPSPGIVASVRVRLTGRNYLQLAEVRVIEEGTGTNLALSGTATQSSQLYVDGGPGAAIDGTVSNRPSVAITREEIGALVGSGFGRRF